MFANLCCAGLLHDGSPLRFSDDSTQIPLASILAAGPGPAGRDLRDV